MLDSHDDENASRLSLIQKAIDESPVIAPVEYATNQAEKRANILKIVYIALVVLDCALIVFNIVAWIVVSENGNACWINDNYNFPYTTAMTEDPDKFGYASDPEPMNVHGMIKTTLVAFGLAFFLNLISDSLKLFIPIDTGFKRKLVNILKGTHLITLLALIYGLYIWFSRAGKICSCGYGPYLPIHGPNITESVLAEIKEDACFGKYTNLYED